MTPVADEAAARRLLVEAEGYLGLEMFDEARERIDAVERAGRLPFECALLVGEWHRERDEHEAAIPRFRKALALRPGDVPATVGLGWCLKRTGRVDLAATAYEEALRHRPSEALLLYNLACYKSLLGAADEAVSLLARAVALDPAFRDLAREEEDFDPIKGLPAFRRVAGPRAQD